MIEKIWSSQGWRPKKFGCHMISNQNFFLVTNYNGGNLNVNILFLVSGQMLMWCATQNGRVTSILTTLVVGHGVRHVQRRYEGGIQEIQIGWEHALTPIEGIPSNILKFPLYNLSIQSKLSTWKSITWWSRSRSGKDQEGINMVK